MSEVRKSSFEPVANVDARLLVLGSLPGDASLAAQQYYAHPANQFWRLIGAVLNEDLAALPYEARLDRLCAGKVALWDVIESAARGGSLDTAIREPAANALPEFVSRLPSLRAVAFNGGTSARIGRRALAGSRVALVNLPSSSAAHAARSLADKMTIWLGLRRWLADGDVTENGKIES